MLNTYEDIAQQIDAEYEAEFETMTAIKSDAQANRLIFIIKNYKEEMQLAAAKAKEVISDYKYRVELWRDKTIDSLENQNQMYLKMLNEYYQAKSPDGKKMKFTNGSIGIYAVRESYNWTDEKALLDYIMEESQNPDLEASGVFDGLLRYKAELNKDAIKSKLQFDSNGEAFINGIHIPFVEHVEKSEAFNVK